MQSPTFRLLGTRTLTFGGGLLPHPGTISGDFLLPIPRLLGGTHAKGHHRNQHDRRNKREPCAEMQRNRCDDHRNRRHGQRNDDDPTSPDRSSAKGAHLGDMLFGHPAPLSLGRLHYSPFRLRRAHVGEPRPAIGIHKMQRRRKPVFAMFDHSLHAFDRPSGQPSNHENHDNRKHDHRA